MFRVKICGITTAADAEAAADAGADAIGLNFYAASPRAVSPDVAAAVVRAAPASLQRVGVFVNAPVALMIETARRLDLAYLQLHGDDTPEVVAALAPLPVVRAFRWRGDPAEVCDYLAACRRAGHALAAVLLDAFAADQYGGTGQTVNWEQVRELGRHLSGVPVVLAGGLSPENVAAAVRQARPAAVDVASGVEASPGQKDAERMRRFVAAARGAWRALGES